MENVLQGLHEDSNVHLDSFQVFCSLYGGHRGLNDFHVLVIPLSFFIASTYPLLLRIKSFDICLYRLVGFLARQDLHNGLDKRLLQLLIDSVKNARQISPIMNFTEHSFFGNCVFKLLEKFANRPCPHVHVILQYGELPLTKLSMHSNWILYFLSAVDYLLTKHAQSARSLDPLVCVALDLLNGGARAGHMLRFGVGRGGQRRRRSC